MQQPHPTEDFYKNIEAIIKEAENLGLEKIVLQKNPMSDQSIQLRKVPQPIPTVEPIPVAIPKVSMPTEQNTHIVEYGNCNVSVPVERVIKSPVFFMENNDSSQNKFITLPTPATAIMEVFNDYTSVSEHIEGDDYRYPSRTFNEIIINEYIKTIDANIYAVFFNGLYQFLYPFLTIDQDKVAAIFKGEETRPNWRFLIQSDILRCDKEEKSMQAVQSICLRVATAIGNRYFDFINTIMFHGFVDMGKIVNYLAELQDIPVDKIAFKQYYMFVEGCLLEQATEDIHKIIEIAEANAVYLLSKYNSNRGRKKKYDEDDPYCEEF